MSSRVRWPAERIVEVLALAEKGFTARQISTEAGVELHAVRNWLQGRIPVRAARLLSGHEACTACGADAHAFRRLHSEIYAYLLGVYLGDGFLAHHRGGVYTLRVALDTAYPGIIAEVVMAIEWMRGRRPHVSRDRTGKNCVVVQSYWKQWPCYFPQHGPGRKHTRPIVLEPWQQAHVDAAPEMFLRGLIHTDGWRGLNRVTVKGKDYAYPRYQFSNRSDDIRKLFTDTCDQLGIEWRNWGTWHISVAKRDSVARMDEFVGLKS